MIRYDTASPPAAGRARTTSPPSHVDGRVLPPMSHPGPVHGLHRVLGNGALAGSSLPGFAVPWLSAKLGASLTGVRVHTDAAADTITAARSAHAVTMDQDIYFAENAYQPQSPEGLIRLLHETAHAVQQRGSAPPDPARAATQEAEVDALLHTGHVGTLTTSAPGALCEPTYPRRTTGNALLREAERVITLSRDTSSTDETVRMWSSVESNFGAITAGSIARRVWTFLFLRHFTEPDPRGGVESSHPRYFYSRTYGWVDAQHFFGFIDYAERNSTPSRSRDEAFEAATARGFQIESDQQLVRDYVMLQRPPATDVTRLMQVRPPNTPLFRAPVAVAGGLARFAAVARASLLSGTEGELFRMLNEARQNKFLDDSAKSAWTYEDPTSNQLGTRFYFQHGERINSLPVAARESEFRNALATFLSSLGVVEDQAEIDRLGAGLPMKEQYSAGKTTEERERQAHPELYRLQRAIGNHATQWSLPGERAPTVVYEGLRSPSRSLDASTRALLEPRFSHDFSGVRVHTDPLAARSARAVGSLAYTVGQDIVFAPGEYDPGSARGQRLIAHELTHVVQQRGTSDLAPGAELRVEKSSSAAESEARQVPVGGGHGSTGPSCAHSTGSAPVLMRADPDAVGQVRKLGTVVGAAIQFWPTTVVDTQIGPVTVQPGLLSSGASQLNVIIGENLTPRVMAREILPLWTTATAFTPPSGGAPVGPGAFTEEQLAQGLLVYNQYYLALPAMTKWSPGLRFPLPVEIDEATGIATVNPDVIRTLAGSFDPTWAPALDQRAASSAPPPAAGLRADVTAFLARETTAGGRGTALGAQAVTNAQASLPFVRDAFAVLGAGGFEVALGFMDGLVNREISLLAAQRDGAAILAQIQTALTAAPAVLSAAQQASLDRANVMLGLVAGAGAAAPAAAMPTRVEKTVSVDTVKLDGSRFTPSTQVAVANAIYVQCNVRFTHDVDATATPAQTTGWLGADRALRASPTCGANTPEERNLYAGASAAFGLSARIRAFFVRDITGYNASGYSKPPYCATGPAASFRNGAVVQNSGDDSTLAHEIGHILLNSGAHPTATIMAPRPRPNEITDPQCTTIYRNA